MRHEGADSRSFASGPGQAFLLSLHPPSPSTEGSLQFWQVLLTQPVTFRSHAHGEGSWAGVTQSSTAPSDPREAGERHQKDSQACWEQSTVPVWRGKYSSKMTFEIKQN